MTDKPYLVEMKSGAHCMCRFERRPDFDVSGKPPKQLDTCGFHSEQARDATALIEEQRAAIAECIEALQKIEEACDPESGWDYDHQQRAQLALNIARAAIAKHAPAPSQEGGK